MATTAFHGIWSGTAQDIGTSYQTFTYDSAYVNTHDFNAAADGTLEIPATGIYLIAATWGGAGNYTRQIRIRKNGTVIRGGNAEVTTGSDGWTTVGQWVGCCVAGDLIDVQGQCGGSVPDTFGACTIVRIPLPFVYALCTGEQDDEQQYSEVSDFEGWHDPGANTKFTVTETGDYMIATCSNSVGGQHNYRINVNGAIMSPVNHTAQGPSFDNTLPILTLIHLEADDYVEVWTENAADDQDREGKYWHFAMWKMPNGAAYVSAEDVSNVISNNNGSPMALAAKQCDTHGFHDNVTNNTRLTVPSGKDGIYLIFGGGYGTHGVANGFWVRENNSATYSFGLGRGGTGSTMVVACRELVAGDYIELYAYDGTTGNTKFDLRLGILRLDDLEYSPQLCPLGSSGLNTIALNLFLGRR